MASTRFLPPIPDGMRIILPEIGVAGITFHQAASTAFMNGGDQSLALVPEPNNIADENAIAVLGIWHDYSGAHQERIGHLSRDTAAAIADLHLVESMCARLRHISEFDDGTVYVQFDLLGPVEIYDRFADAIKRAYNRRLKNKLAEILRTVRWDTMPYVGVRRHGGRLAHASVLPVITKEKSDSIQFIPLCGGNPGREVVDRQVDCTKCRELLPIALEVERTFSCQGCGQRLRVRRRSIGKIFGCPKCHANVEISAFQFIED